jgi:hypothetical protein
VHNHVTAFLLQAQGKVVGHVFHYFMNMQRLFV